MPKTYYNLQELTYQESGAVQYATGDIWIGNWTQIHGIPRQFITGMIGLGDEFTAKRCATPRDVKRAMNDHERELDCPVSRSGFKSWQVTTQSGEELTVTINHNWN